MNYRHIFHAGNFADVVKHAMLLQLLASLRLYGEPLDVVDTHAGAGTYRLDAPETTRSAEAKAGILRLLEASDAPAAFDRLTAAVQAFNPRRTAPWRYPGSPLLILNALRLGDRYIGCELRSDDHAALASELAAVAKSAQVVGEARLMDGFSVLTTALQPRRRTLVLIDPSYEQGDDAERIGSSLAQARRLCPALTALVWAPIKDLAGYDALLSRLEQLGFEAVLSAQLRLRPLSDPLRLNGCVLVLLGAVREIRAMHADAQAIFTWAAARLGEPGARSVVEASA